MLAETDQIVVELLKQMRQWQANGGPDKVLPGVLERIQGMPGVAGAALMPAWPQSKPELPYCSTAWDANYLNDAHHLRSLAQYLSRVKETTYHRRCHGDPPALRWLAGGLRVCDSTRFAFVPLRPFIPREFAGDRVFELVLVVALAPAPQEEEAVPELHKEDFEFLAWAIANLKVNLESTRLARRHRELAISIDEGVTQLLSQTPPWQSGQTHFGELVENIRALMNCDTCQLYLLPQYAACIKSRSADRIWLVAEQVADRRGLRYLRGEPSLITYLWRNSITSPLNIPNVLESPEFSQFALTKLGLTRHFLGVLLTTKPYEAIGVLALREKYGRAPDGYMCITEDGFSHDDTKRLEHRAAELTRLLELHRGRLLAPDVREQIEGEVESIRHDLCADTCQLYLTPAVQGAPSEGGEAYMELYYHGRQHWLCEANYQTGERLTGQVLAGQPINEPDVLLRFRETDSSTPGGARKRPGKYRLSQHFLAVPVPAPAAFGDEPAAGGAIGVLKVRDRLQKDRVTLAAQGFTSEDQHLLQAFARMISVKIAIREHMLRREREQLVQTSEVAHDIRHDLGNALWAAKLQLNDLPLAKNLEYLPELLADAARMVDRSWIAAKVAGGTYAPPDGGQRTCDLTALLRDLFRSADRCLAPDPESGANLLIQSLPFPGTDLRVRCDQTLLEVAILALPVWLYHQALAAGWADAGQQLPITLGVEPLERTVRLQFIAPVGCPWPTLADQEKSTAGVVHINYPKLLSCPMISWDALAGKLAYYDAQLTWKPEAKQTQIWIDLELVRNGHGTDTSASKLAAPDLCGTA